MSNIAKRHNGTITNWGIVWWSKFQTYVVVGEWIRSLDQQFIRTSEIVALSQTDRGMMVETKNSFYDLRGEPRHEEAQQAFAARYGEGK